MDRREFIKKGIAAIVGFVAIPFSFKKPEWKFNVGKYDKSTPISCFNGRPVAHFIEGEALNNDEINKRFQEVKSLFQDLPPLCDFWEMK